jgi:hypothetical protein
MSPGQALANKRPGRLRAEGIYAGNHADGFAGLRMQPTLLGIVTGSLGRIFLEQLASTAVQ